MTDAWKNRLCFGDNLEILRKGIASESGKRQGAGLVCRVVPLVTLVDSALCNTLLFTLTVRWTQATADLLEMGRRCCSRHGFFF